MMPHCDRVWTLVCRAIRLLPCLLILAGQAHMVRASEDKLWHNEIGLGLVITTGNTQSENFNIKADSVRDSERWRLNLHLESLRTSKEDEITARKVYGSSQGDYKFDGDKRYLFIRVAYEDDEFSGFDHQMDLSLGYGQTLFERPGHKLWGDIGPGYRRSELNDGTSKSEGIMRLALAWDWEISDNAGFEQRLSTEIADNTISRSTSTLTTTILDNLAMKVSIGIKHSSEVPPTRKKTDTETSVTLVYSF